MKKELTVAIPVYNEEKTVGKVIEEVLSSPYVREVIVVNDASQDDSFEQIKRYGEKVILVNNQINRGKGYSVREALKLATSEYFLVQDADNELSPSSYSTMIDCLEKEGVDMVNAIRVFSNPNITLLSRIASMIIPFIIFVFFGKRIVDVVSCYKLMKTERYKKLNLESERFEIETEIVVKAIKNNYKICEVKVPYNPRRKDEGKHVNWKDGIKVIRLILKLRFKKTQ